MSSNQPEIPNPSNGVEGKLEIIRSQQFSGPLPPPMLLEQYEICVPGSANRIIQMTEKEGDHRRSTQNTIIRRSFNEAARGQFLAAAVALFAMGASVYLGIQDKQVIGSVLGGTTMLMLVTAFLKTRTSLPEPPKAPPESSSTPRKKGKR